jgi:hypothetical protein
MRVSSMLTIKQIEALTKVLNKAGVEECEWMGVKLRFFADKSHEGKRASRARSGKKELDDADLQELALSDPERFEEELQHRSDK